MISVIVSTHNPDLLKKLSNNLAQTIGVRYELIAVENYAQYSICEAYNMGIDKSNYPYLCFIHEDVLLKTENWGKRLISIMEKDSTIGLIGIVGSKFKSTYPLSGWGQGSTLNKYKRGHVYHQLGNNNLKTHLNFNEDRSTNEIEDVVCLDGVFLFSKKEAFKQCRFDEKMLTNFHGYDTDISLQVFFNSFRVVVDRGIELIHFSGGNYSVEYTNTNKKIWRKWISRLPVASSDLKLTRFQLHKTDAINFMCSLNDSIKRKLHIQ